MDIRLRQIAAFVRPGSRLADIGTDHGQLPVALVSEGVCPRAIASDLRKGPAAAARAAVKAAGLNGRVDVRVGDGLSVLLPDEADDIVIAGLGGETIAAILAAVPWICAPRYRLILQPMTRPEALRRFLLTSGFELFEETAVVCGTRVYLVLCAGYTGAAPVTDEKRWLCGALHGEAGRRFLQKQCRRLQKQLSGLKKADRMGTVEAAEAARQLSLIRAYLEEEWP